MLKIISTTIAIALFSTSIYAKEVFQAKHVGSLPEGPEISWVDIKNAQESWGNAVVKIGQSGERAPDVAKEIAKNSYAFEYGPILFKPTLASEQPFRSDLTGTLSYFVSGNPDFPEDSGFALKPWKDVKFENNYVKIFGNKAIAMGHYYFTDSNGNVTKVEYSKGYVKSEDGRVLIFMQDSSLPYSG